MKVAVAGFMFGLGLGAAALVLNTLHNVVNGYRWDYMLINL